MAKNNPIFFNRELSWLEFNQRVLEEAKDPDNPMLERLKFLAITASNLDEFFMVRVGGLQMARQAGRRKKDPAGMTPLTQLRRIHARARLMMEEAHRVFREVVSPALKSAGVRHVKIKHATAEQGRYLHDFFMAELFPVVTPIALEGGRAAPLSREPALHLLVRLSAPRKKGKESLAVVSLARSGGRLVRLPSERGYEYVLREEVVKHFAPNWFPGREIREMVVFRVTRNADFAVAEEEAPDLLKGMEEVLEDRKTGECVRLEVEAGASEEALAYLREHVPASEETIYSMKGPLNLRDFMDLAFIPGYDELKVEPWPPQPSPLIAPNEPMFERLQRGDVLLYHPYESFDPVLRFIEEAAADPDTLAIKMVLYRTSSESAVIAALRRAAENGVNVTVLMELKARFDEARNMEWARELSNQGAQVIHGVKGYKTHAKICMVVRREPASVERYCHFGTGNYNESTAKLYGDISYMTRDPELGADAAAFFNALCGYARPRDLNLISMAPLGLRDRIVELIDYEIERASSGKKALIQVKVNSLVDVALSNKLREAAAAGVRVRLNIRGICCLPPSENMEIISVIDRYLEHARVLHFHHGGKPRVFISSADWMPRNLDKRLELMVPVEDPRSRDRLIRVLETHLADDQSAWKLEADGSYLKKNGTKDARLRSQETLYHEAVASAARSAEKKQGRFEPHRPT